MPLLPKKPHERSGNMKKTLTALALISAAIIPTTGAIAQDASIPFVDYGGIQNWSAQNDSTLMVQAMNNKWYRVGLMMSCSGLPFATRVGFDTGPVDTFDRFSSVIVDGQRCPVQSITLVNSPP